MNPNACEFLGLEHFDMKYTRALLFDEKVDNQSNHKESIEEYVQVYENSEDRTLIDCLRFDRFL